MKRKAVRWAVARCPSRIAMVKRMVEPKRRKPGRPKGPSPVRETVVALKGSKEWKTWLDGFSYHCRLGIAVTIEQSLVYYAKRREYRRPPKR
jgi:hypothetical protein